jgi:hypothetical protein
MRSLLLVLDHDTKPLLEVFLHLHSAPLQQILNSFDLCLQVFQLVIVGLIRLLESVDLLLELLFFLRVHELATLVYHSSKGVLLPDLFDLIGQILDLLSVIVNAYTQLLAATVLLFEQLSVLFHRLVLAVAFSKHLESFGPVSQVF